MKKNFYLTIALFFNLIQTQAQVALPYSTGFDNAGEQSGWEEYRLSAGTQFYFWNYSTANPHSAPNCLAHNYPVGGSSVTDDWFVSPMFNLEDGGMIDSIWHSFSGFGAPQTADTLAIYLIIGSQNPSLASERILLHDFRTGYENDNVWRNTTDIEIPNAAAHSHIAIRYKTVVNWLDVRFDDIQISGNNTAGIKPQLAFQNEVVLFPNPAKEFLYISSDSFQIGETVKLSVFDMMGKNIIEDAAFIIGKSSLSIETLTKGNYAICISSNKKTMSSIFVKE